jgi:bifunctional ADP-heptose synthase (sugar kinase/adenylyltransferase)
MYNELINDFMNKVSSLNVAIIGETIVDEFIDVSYEGQSMKSVCPVLKLGTDKLTQKGGTAAIYRHIKPFVSNIDIITNTKNEIVKTRYIDYNNKKHIEINTFKKFNNKFDIDCSKYDLVIVADFGHGFLENINLRGEFSLMCQTNSNNFGFNRVSKWKEFRKKSVCLDKREACLQLNKNIDLMKDSDVLNLYNYEINSKYLFITLGGEGVIFTDGKNIIRNKSFKNDNIVDTIGAGDTFFAFSSLCSVIDIDQKLINIIPSLAANLSTTWICNEQSITPEKLINYGNTKLSTKI